MVPKLTTEQIQAIHASQGQPVVVVDEASQTPYFLIPASDDRVRDLIDTTSEGGEWTEQMEMRRTELIDKDIAGIITSEERVELAKLDRVGNAYFDRVAPRPLAGIQQLHRALTQKRDSQ